MKNTSLLALVGGYGFVGRNILEAVSNDTDLAHLSPVIIANLSNPAPGHAALGLPDFIGDYDEAGAFDFLAQQSRADSGRIFVFLAGETRVAESKDRPLDFIDANISAPSRFVMQAVQPGDHFILISTAGALFDGTFEVSVDSPYCPKNFYGATKAAEEMILEKLVRKYQQDDLCALCTQTRSPPVVHLLSTRWRRSPGTSLCFSIEHRDARVGIGRYGRGL